MEIFKSIIDPKVLFLLLVTVAVASLLMVINHRACVSAGFWLQVTAHWIETLSPHESPLSSLRLPYWPTSTKVSFPFYRVNMIYAIHHRGDTASTHATGLISSRKSTAAKEVRVMIECPKGARSPPHISRFTYQVSSCATSDHTVHRNEDMRLRAITKACIWHRNSP